MGGAYLLRILIQVFLAWSHATRIYHSMDHQLLVGKDKVTWTARTSRGAAIKSSSASEADSSDASCIIRLTAVDLRLTFGRAELPELGLDILVVGVIRSTSTNTDVSRRVILCRCLHSVIYVSSHLQIVLPKLHRLYTISSDHQQISH